MIKQVGRRPIERDTVYNVVKDYTDYDWGREEVELENRKN
jgi:aminodeoxyfutalosine synthase